MTDVPAPESPGGAIAFGPIERPAIIALSGVRALATFKDATKEDVAHIRGFASVFFTAFAEDDWRVGGETATNMFRRPASSSSISPYRKAI